MKRNPRRKSSEWSLPTTGRRSPSSIGAVHRLTNLELTPGEIAQALDAFRKAVIDTKEAFQQGLELLPHLTGEPLKELTMSCTRMERFLTEERPKVISEIENLYEDALAHLMHHLCAVDPFYLEEIIKLAPHQDPPVPRLLSANKLKHYDGVLAVTGGFLKAKP